MIDQTPIHWVRLKSGYDLGLHGTVPIRLSNSGRSLSLPDDELVREVQEQSGLRVKLGPWTDGEGPGEREARVVISGQQMGEVLRRLAVVSAGVYVDRFNKPIDPSAVDWDAAEYAYDMNLALEYCGLTWHDVDKATHFDAYVTAMHQETERLAGRKAG